MDLQVTCTRAVARQIGRTAHSCHWGEPTLFLPFPQWLDALHWEWSCRHTAHRGPLKVVENCGACPEWERRSAPVVDVVGPLD
jgi:hypothetical protein